uniref:CNH domain-containing protein n=1 Tax=Ananas comosus var. bracteatus TaxID=296719 RepID=A0A6V7QL15_ANACO|nr:unnamed protein product [Ananas comosus var. bracteatus]
MGRTELNVLSKLDGAKTQLYHFTAIVITGMGFFTDAYDLFSISLVTKLLGRIYYYDPSYPAPGILPPTSPPPSMASPSAAPSPASSSSAGSATSSAARRHGHPLLPPLLARLRHRRRLPLSATIMSEYANKKTRGSFIAAVFAMQGFGILVGGIVSLIVSAAFNDRYHAPPFSQDPAGSTVPQADYVWRIILMFGAVPAALTYYWRMKMPETARYTALVARNAKQAAADMSKVLQEEIGEDDTELAEQPTVADDWGLFSPQFARRHGIHLLATSTTWFFLDIAYYSQNLFQKDIFSKVGDGLLHDDRVHARPRGPLPPLDDARAPRRVRGHVRVHLLLRQLWAERDDVHRAGRGVPGAAAVDLPRDIGGGGEGGAIVGAFGFLYASQGKALAERDRGYPAGIGIRNTLFVLAASNFLGLAFSLLVPEAKGRSLEEMSKENEGEDDASLDPAPRARDGAQRVRLRGAPPRLPRPDRRRRLLRLEASPRLLRLLPPHLLPRSLSSSDDASASSAAAAAADAAAAEIRRDSYALERAIPGFWRRPPLAMEVSASRDLLLSLSEWVALHRLPSLETLVAVAKTKGASVYSWDDRRGLLCVGRQKRVAIYRLDGGREFVEVKEFSVPDVVKSMAWCGENICLGIRREYMIMNSLTGSLSEVFPAGRIAPPLVVPLPSGELLLGKDNIGVFVDQNGKLLQDGRICWSEAPGSVVIHKPYAIARLPRHVEVRSLKAPNQLVQTIVLRDVHLLLQTNNCILAALGNSVYGLLPVPLGAQIVQLTASGDFEEALALCKLLPPEDSTLRAAKESSIHIRYGHFLFDNGSYEESMEQFLASQVDITYVLSLYPMSSDASDEMESSLPIQHQESDLEMKKMSHNSLTALVKYLQKRRFSIIERATAEVTEEVVSVVQDSMALSDPHRPKTSNKRRSQIHISSVAREMATVLDTALLQALLLTGQTSGALELLKGLNYCDLKICEEFLKERNFYIVLLELYKSNELHREALKLLNQLVEESKSGLANSELNQKFKPNMIIEYLRPLCRTDPMLVLESSLTVLESCPTETIELFLSENVPADLVNSYLKQHAPNLQSTYLELMLSMSENGINPNLQNELVQIYLSEVLDWYQDLKDEQKWDEKTYSQTRKKLISALEGISGYNAEVLLKRLPQDALFEERAILLGKLNQHHLALSLYVHKLHLPELAVAYCDRVYEAGSSQPPKSNVNIYLTLLQIYLNPQKTKKEFERRTISVPSQSPITQKVGYTKFKGSRNSKKIAEIEGADDMRISLSSTDSGRSDGDGDEYAEGGGSAMLNEALELLSQRWDRINGAQALKLLPRETKLQNLLSFLEPLLKKSSEHRRNYAVIKNLIFRAHLQVKEDLSKSRQTVVKIDGESTCSLCRKRIGNSAFAVYPNGKTLVHFVCFRDSQRIKAVRGAPQSSACSLLLTRNAEKY